MCIQCTITSHTRYMELEKYDYFEMMRKRVVSYKNIGKSNHEALLGIAWKDFSDKKCYIHVYKQTDTHTHLRLPHITHRVILLPPSANNSSLPSIDKGMTALLSEMFTAFTFENTWVELLVRKTSKSKVENSYETEVKIWSPNFSYTQRHSVYCTCMCTYNVYTHTTTTTTYFNLSFSSSKPNA